MKVLWSKNSGLLGITYIHGFMAEPILQADRLTPDLT